MREFREVRKRLGERPEESSPYVLYARKLLAELKRDMEFGGLKQGVRRRQVDGVLIEAISIFGQDEIRITPPNQVRKQSVEQKKRRRPVVLWVGDFANGLTGSFLETVALNAASDPIELVGVAVITSSESSAYSNDYTPCDPSGYIVGTQRQTRVVTTEIYTHLIPIRGALKSVYEKLKKEAGTTKATWDEYIEQYKVQTSTATMTEDHVWLQGMSGCVLFFTLEEWFTYTYSIENPFGEIRHSISKALIDQDEDELIIYIDGHVCSIFHAARATLSTSKDCTDEINPGWGYPPLHITQAGLNAAEVMSAASIGFPVVVGGNGYPYLYGSYDLGHASWEIYREMGSSGANLLSAMLSASTDICTPADAWYVGFGIVSDVESVIYPGDTTAITGKTTAEINAWRADRITKSLIGYGANGLAWQDF